MNQPLIRMTRTITIVSDVPYNSNYYPDMSLEQAVEFERNASLLDKIENFSEDLAIVSTDDTTKFRFHETVTIVRENNGE